MAPFSQKWERFWLKLLTVARKVVIFPLLILLKFYKFFISPYVGNACRYSPTCSVYAMEALRKHGLFKGSYLAVKRILRCHPWGGSGYDPVP
ncbi:MAG: membrane protein insertion efficiency factor YidD [Bacteroidales bacterium]|nr:membrane protein insertion efficiency factor YidD [Bacteroidales bacterium]